MQTTQATPDLFKTITVLLGETCGLDPGIITAQMDLRTELGVNSLALAALVFRAEEEFGIDIVGQFIDPATIQTVSDVANLVASLVRPS